MPLIVLECVCGYTEDAYVPLMSSEAPARQCADCATEMTRGLAWGHPLRYFSEKSPRRIVNLDGGRTAITSHGQHQALMKSKGVEPATDWHTSGRRSKH